jgi:hypothetical protein
MGRRDFIPLVGGRLWRGRRSWSNAPDRVLMDRWISFSDVDRA